VFDVDQRTFQQAVVERSHTVPVVVDFWAPWCGPCRMLGPVLEQLAGEYGGKFELAKLNTDENPSISQAFGITGIPAVKAFKDGRVANEFVGALPEPRVRAFLETLMPSEADVLTRRADELAEAGHLNAAEDAYREALRLQPVHAAATIGLARVLSGQGDVQRQEALRLLSAFPNDQRAAQLKAEIAVGEAAASVDTVELERRIGDNPKDVDAQYKLGMALAAAGSYEQALDHLLTVVRLDRGYDDDAGRRAMLDLFNLLGNEHPLTATYRRRLSQLLF
jgi:putative thioredoxin